MHISLQRISKEKLRVAALFLGVLVVALVGVFFMQTPLTSVSDARLHGEADSVINACAEESYKPACYDKEIPKVMDRGLTLEESFKVTRIIQEKDTSYWYCHVLGHNVSAKEAAKDISKWTEVVARCPQGMCSNGCLHGAFQERFRGEIVSDEELEELIPEIDSICKKGGGRNFTGLEQASCYHAIGHLTMYITNADIERAVDVCDRVASKSFQGLCYDGAYMQIFQPLEPEDIALVQDIAPQTREEAIDFCAQFDGRRRTSCYMETWPLFVEDFDTQFGAIERFCDREFSHRDRVRCFNGVFYVMAAQSNFDETQITKLCSYVSDSVKAQCYANSASRFLETDYKLAQKAVAVCEQARSVGVAEQCYEELLFYSAYNYHVGSDAYISLCRSLPGEWKDRCLLNEGTRMPAPFYET